MSFDPFESGISIPVFDWLLATSDITALDALVYGKLAFYRGKGADRECRPSVGRVARELRLDERDCRKRIVKLERIGLIQRVERPGRPNVIVFLDPGSKSPGVKDPGVNPPSVEIPLPPRGEFTQGPRGETPLQSEQTSELTSDKRRATAVGEPSVAEQIVALEARYKHPLPRRAREACALSRRTGKMSDPVWLHTLERLAVLSKHACEYALRAMDERHADGSKDEKYLLGIARREASRAQHPKPANASNSGNGAIQRRIAEEPTCDR